MLPTTQSPVLMPTLTFRGICLLPLSPASAFSAWFNTSSSSNITRADSQACSGWSSSSRGAFQNAMFQSPMYLSMVPLRAGTPVARGMRGSCRRSSSIAHRHERIKDDKSRSALAGSACLASSLSAACRADCAILGPRIEKFLGEGRSGPRLPGLPDGKSMG